MLPHLRLLSFEFRVDHELEWNGFPVEFKLGKVFTFTSLVVRKVQGICNMPPGYFRALKHLKELAAGHDFSVSTDLKKIQSLGCLTLSGTLNASIVLLVEPR